MTERDQQVEANYLGQETQRMDTRPVNICTLYSFGSMSRMVSACVVATVKHGGRGLMVWVVTLLVIYSKIQGTLDQHGS